MKYDLRSLAKRAGAKRGTVTLREIKMPRMIERELEAIVVLVVRQWQESVENLILPAYGAARDDLVRDDAYDTMRQALVIATTAGTRVSLSLTSRVQRWLERVDRWHRLRWVGVAKATGVDVFPFVDLKTNTPQIAAMQERISSLITSIDEAARKDVAETVWRGFLEQTPRREMGKQIKERLQVQRSRANFIASDQANKTAAELTKIRQQEAGINKFAWETAEDVRVRPEHAALQGKIFSWDKPPSIGLPGTPPRCRCTGRAVIEFDDED